MRAGKPPAEPSSRSIATVYRNVKALVDEGWLKPVELPGLGLIQFNLVEKSRKGAIVVDATLRVPGRDGVWALGDCASIPDPRPRAIVSTMIIRKMAMARGVSMPLSQ